MPKPLRIFISSPGDVGPERRRAALVIESLKKEFARFFEIQAYLWEHEAMLATGHFQDVIEPPSASDIVVLILWSRLGTPLPERSQKREYRGLDGRVPVTGTEWEYEDALAANRSKGAPDLLVYRSNREPQISLRDPAKKAAAESQWSALEDFWTRYFQAGGVFLSAYHGFEDVEDFGDMLEAHLRQLIKTRIERDRIEHGGEAKATWMQAPFRGLAAYDFEHAPIFFGRGLAQLRAVERIVQNAAAGSAFLLVLGASGSGKSSLVRAGVLPNLFARGVVEGAGLWRRVALKPGDAEGNLFRGLARALVEDRTKEGYGLPELLAPGVGVEQIEAALRRSTDDPSFVFAPALGRVTHEARAAGRILQHESGRLALVLDQLEEIFTDPAITTEEREAFVALLKGLARQGQVWTIATMRSDFWHRAAASPALVALAEGQGRMDLLAPSPSELAEMIRRPASAAGLAFEDHPETRIGLDAVIAEEASRDPGSLPLVSFVLDALYRADVEGAKGSTLRYETYEALGGIKGAIAKRADEVLSAQPQAVQDAFPPVLRALVTVSQDRDQGATARVAPLEAFPAGTPRRALVDAFLDPSVRLLIADGDGAQARVRVAHEALINHWTRAKEQIARDRRDLETRARLEEDETVWRQAQGAEKAERLLDGLSLEEGKDLVAKWGDELPPELKEFIEVSRKASSAKRNRRFRVLVGVAASMAVLAVAAGATGLYAVGQNAALVEQTRVAEEQKGIAQEQSARAVAESERAVAAEGRALEQLNETLRSRAVVTARRASQAAALGSPELELPIALEAARVAAQAEGETPPVVLAGMQRALAEDVVVSVLSGWNDDVSDVRFGPNSNDVLTRLGNQLVIWDASKGQERYWYGRNDLRFLNYARDPNGKFFILAYDDKSVEIRNWQDDSLIGEPLAFGGNVTSIALDDDGRVAVFGDESGAARFVTPGTGAADEAVAAHDGAVSDVALAANLALAVSGGWDGKAVLWDPGARAKTGVEVTHGDGVTVGIAKVRVSPKGDRFVTIGGGFASVFAADGTRIAFINPKDVYTHDVLFSPDGRTLIAATGKTITVYDAEKKVTIDGVETLLPLREFSGHSFDVRRLVLSRDGRTLLSASGDNTVRLWDLATSAQGRVLIASPYAVQSLDLSLDGRFVAAAFASGNAVIWRTDELLARRVTQRAATWNINSVAFSPDGSQVVTAAGDGKVTVAAADGLFEAQTAVDSNDAYNAVYSPDGTRIYVAHAGDEVLAYDSALQSIVKSYPMPGGYSPAWVAATADGAQVLAATYAGVYVFDAESQAVVRRLSAPQVWLRSLDVSPDGKRAAAGTADGFVLTWDVETGAPLWSVRMHASEVQRVAFSPDGRSLASSSSDRTVRVADAATGELRLLIPDNSDLVMSVAYSPDGTRLATAAFDSTVRIFDASTGAQLARLSAEGKAVRSARFSPDGRTVAATGDDLRIFFYDLDGMAAANAPGGKPPLAADMAGKPGEALGGVLDWGPLTVWKPLSRAERESFGLASDDTARRFDSAAGPCDILAAWQSDPQRVAAGVIENALDVEAAEAACRKAVEAEPGNPRLRMQLGRAILHAGRREEALAELKAAADAGYPGAVYYYGFALAVRLSDGSSAEERKLGLEMIRKAADMGVVDAGEQVAFFLRQGLEGPNGEALVEIDPEASIAMLKEYAEKGSWFASASLSDFYERGYSRDYGPDGAKKTFELKADRVEALYYYALGARQMQAEALIESTELKRASFMFAKRGSIARSLVREGKQAEVAEVARRVAAWKPPAAADAPTR